MSTRQLLIILLIAVAVLYVLFFVQIMVLLSAKNNNTVTIKNKRKKAGEQTLTCSPAQTEFYKKSARYAMDVLYGKQFLEKFGERDYYATPLVSVINKLNAEAKKSIVLAMQYSAVSTQEAKATEIRFRKIADEQQVPLWYIILSEAVKKAMPEINIYNTPNAEMKIINLKTA